MFNAYQTRFQSLGSATTTLSLFKQWHSPPADFIKINYDVIVQSFVYKEGNQEAHQLAKFVLDQGRDFL